MNIVSRLTLVVVAVVGLVGAASAARKPKPQPCPPGRYLVTQGAPIVTGAGTPQTDAVVVSTNQLVIGSGCVANVKPKGGKTATVINARFPTCGDLAKVKLTARIPSPACNTLDGSLKAKKTAKRAFSATLSTCGDQRVDSAIEECDGDGCTAPARCNGSCACETPPTTTTTPSTSTSTTGASTTSTTRSPTTTTTGTGLCGNGNVDSGETCDDSNTSDNDACPIDCIVDPCTAVGGSSLVASINFVGPSVPYGGIHVLLDYPEGKVSLPGAGGMAATRFSMRPAATSLATNNLGPTGNAHIVRVLVTNNDGFTPFSPGLLAKANFETCQGAAAPTADEFFCAVLDASDLSGNDLDPNLISCNVTIP